MYPIRYVTEASPLHQTTKLRHMDLSSVMSSRWLQLSSYQFLMPLLRTHGIDVGQRDLSRPLPRGIPAYASQDADLERVQRNMARGLIRSCFVVDQERVVGAVEIRHLAALADSLWGAHGRRVRSKSEGTVRARVASVG